MITRGVSINAVNAGYRTAGESITVVRDVNGHVGPGELVCLLGVNGAGKSTLLRTLTGSQPPLSGTITLDGRDLTAIASRERARQLAVVLSDRVDVQLMRAEEIVSMGRAPHQDWMGRNSDHDRLIVERSMARVGAISLRGRQMSELSDGERQRVMLARALAQEPKVLVLDEPLAFLDLVRRVELIALMRDLANEGLAILLSVHDVELALRVADRLWIIDTNGGFIEGGPEDLALAGTIGDTFASDLVQFDHHSGSFVAKRGYAKQFARIEADGLRLIWGGRAMERAGWIATNAESEVVLSTLPGEKWKLKAGCRLTKVDTLEEVVRALKEV